MSNIDYNDLQIAHFSEHQCSYEIRELVKSFDYKVLGFDNLNDLIKAKNNFALIIYETNGQYQQHKEVVLKLKKNFSDSQIIIIDSNYNSLHAEEYLKLGVFWYFSSPLKAEEFRTSINKAYIIYELSSENKNLRNILNQEVSGQKIFSLSNGFKALLEKIDVLSKLNSTLLLTGESGTGKSTLARYVHSLSERKTKPFIALSCAAFPKELLEAELFGYNKGAFTGANENRKGCFEAADGGTLFLDEIAELPLEMQAKLLTVLQDFEVKRLGSTQSKKVDVRLIAATNKDLESMCRQGLFREDLYFRIFVLHVNIPPLREHIEDLPLLIKNSLEKIAVKRGTEIYELSEEAQKKLMQHSWPGNIRELENTLERASAFAGTKIIQKEDLDFSFINTGLPHKTNEQISLAGLSLAEIEKRAILETLDFYKGDKVKSAKSLGISLKSLYNKL